MKNDTKISRFLHYNHFIVLSKHRCFINEENIVHFYQGSTFKRKASKSELSKKTPTKKDLDFRNDYSEVNNLFVRASFWFFCICLMPLWFEWKEETNE